MTLRAHPVLTACCLLVLAVCSAFYPCVSGGFSNWDDARYVRDNEQVRSISPSGVAAIFTSLHGGVYKPLTILSFAADYRMFGLKAGWYHAENTGWHCANALLVFFIALMLLGSHNAAFLVAGLFALHPMHAESVAWIAERKDMLYSFFLLLSMLLYLNWKSGSGKMLLWWSVAAALLSLLAKPMGVTIPLLLLALDYFQSEKLTLRSVAEKWPYFVLALAFGSLALFTMGHAEVYFTRAGYTRWDYICSGFYGLLFYVQRLFLPVNLSAIYTFPRPDSLPLLWHLGPFIALACAGLFVWFFFRCHQALAAGAFFIMAIAPGLQWIPLAPSLAFDHYTYIAYLGPFLLAAWLTARLAHGRIWARAGWVAVLLLCLIGTNRRCALWADDEALWTDAIEKQPASAIARMNRAQTRMERGNLNGATEDLDIAISLEPAYALAIANRGSVKFREGDIDAADEDYGRALYIDSSNPVALTGRGAILVKKGKRKEAMEYFEKASRLAPHLTDAKVNAAGVKLFEGDAAGAKILLDKALEDGPSARALALLAQANLMQGRPADAARLAGQALELEPAEHTALSVRGAAFYFQGDAERALGDLKIAIAQEPADVNAHLYSALSHLLLKECRAAEAEFRETRRYAPPGVAFPEAAQAIAQCGKNI